MQPMVYASEGFLLSALLCYALATVAFSVGATLRRRATAAVRPRLFTVWSRWLRRVGWALRHASLAGWRSG
jgi:hypothetical protein